MSDPRLIVPDRWSDVYRLLFKTKLPRQSWAILLVVKAGGRAVGWLSLEEAVIYILVIDQWQVPLPESVKVFPATGINCQS